MSYLDDIAAELRLWLGQQGQDRVHLDRDVLAAAAAGVARPAPVEAATEAAESPSPAAAEETAPLAVAKVMRDAKRQAEKAALLAKLDAEEVSVCQKCALSKTRNKTVFGVGNPDADLVFVGEAPGADEDRQGEPFVGRAGQLLTKIIGAMGFTRDDVYICNILKCRPENNRDPAPDEVLHCEPYLVRQLEILEPKVICALGRIAAQTLLKSKVSLTKMRTEVHDYHGVPLVVTYHPAALLRNPNWKRPTWEDVRKLRIMYDERVG